MKTQNGEHKNNGGSSKPNLDTTTTLPAHPGKTERSPNTSENNAHLSPRPNIVENYVQLNPILASNSNWIRESDYELSRNEQNKSEDPKS